TTQEHYALRGWEMGHFMEPDKESIDFMLRLARVMENPVLCFGFHPAFAVKSKAPWPFIDEQGNLGRFKYCLESCKRSRIPFVSNSKIYELTNSWERILMRQENGNLCILNSGDLPEMNIYLEMSKEKKLEVREFPKIPEISNWENGYVIKSLAPGENIVLEIVNRD
ncbi:MAG: hypothetical protein ABIA63_15690, partial [bacterium]